MIEKYFNDGDLTFTSASMRRLVTSAVRHDIARGPQFRLTETLDDIDKQKIAFAKYAVPSHLQPYVESWSYLHDSSVRYSVERIVPRMGASLVINLNIGRFLSNSIVEAHQGSVMLFDERSLDIRLTPEIRRIFVHFTPSGLYMLTGISQKELVNRVTDANYIFGPAFRDLYARLLDSSDPLGELVSFFSKLAAKVEETVQSEVVQYVLGHIDKPILPTLEKTGYTRKHVVNLFREFTGTTPKRLQLIHRVHRATLQFNPVEHSLFKLTDGEEFYDEAHFSKLFKRFFGMSPLRYKQEGFYCSRRMLI